MAEVSKELEAVREAIHAWMAANDDGSVMFFGSFWAWDSKGNAKQGEDLHFAYGEKDVLLSDIEQMQEFVNEEDEGLVNI